MFQGIYTEIYNDIITKKKRKGRKKSNFRNSPIKKKSSDKL